MEGMGQQQHSRRKLIEGKEFRFKNEEKAGIFHRGGRREAAGLSGADICLNRFSLRTGEQAKSKFANERLMMDGAQ